MSRNREEIMMCTSPLPVNGSVVGETLRPQNVRMHFLRVSIMSSTVGIVVKRDLHYCEAGVVRRNTRMG
jgi:hypothetical protein